MKCFSPFSFFTLVLVLFLKSSFCSFAQKPGVPSIRDLAQPFGAHDQEKFRSPDKVFYPETWFHYIGGNVSHAGITADLEAIAASGISGVQFFHGQFGGPWPGVEPQIACLSPLWEGALKHTAEECRRLGLRFTMQNCPGWAMSGGPWIEPSNAMRHLVWSRTDVVDKWKEEIYLPAAWDKDEAWRDYKDVTVLAFPTPLDDTGVPLKPSAIKSSLSNDWEDYLAGSAKGPMNISSTTLENPHWLEVEFPEAVKVRTLEFPSINTLSHAWCFEPGVSLAVYAILPDGEMQTVLNADMPQSTWQENYPISIACNEIDNVKKYRIEIVNKHDITLNSLRLFSAARKNNWESEAGWLLRSHERTGANPLQSLDAYLNVDQIYDLSSHMDKNGKLNWKAPDKGSWTLLRVGHVNTGMKNSPAPPEGTGWECDKLSKTGPEAQFAGYIGRLSNGVLDGGLLNGMLLDSWECRTQTWTNDMEAEFLKLSGYELRHWLPAVFGYVINDHETTARFLLDWRSVIGNLFANNFYGHMAELARENELTITYETAAGDVFPADIMEYFKFADIPMCEFWHPLSDSFVGSLNFKPIKPTTSAARVYGKPRVAAEAFTSFNLTWDEKWEMLKEVANVNMAEGVSHMVFHTYTHNPRTDFLPPGTSFGSNIGTPFLRGQTWWKHMPELTSYLSRCSYMLERGKPVSDVLWYLGDEINHKPDQLASFPKGYKYDYCNPDVLLTRLSVKDGKLITPEGISYRVLWLPSTQRMLPETLEKLSALIKDGAIVVGNAPGGLATLSGGNTAQVRFDKGIKEIWGSPSAKGVRRLGKGMVIPGMDLGEALDKLNIMPDVKGEGAMWMHRQTDGADWYFVSAPEGEGFKGSLDFRATGQAEWWDPVTGEITPTAARQNGAYTSVAFDLAQAGSGFLVFRSGETRDISALREVENYEFESSWQISFPSGWGAPETMEIKHLLPWKELNMSAEGKAFSGTATYKTTFNVDALKSNTKLSLDLGHVDMIAVVAINGKPLRTLWASPYKLDITDAVRIGTNTLTVEVTSTWFNRLVFDASQPEEARKTWTINGPSQESSLRNSGLMGPVRIVKEK